VEVFSTSATSSRTCPQYAFSSPLTLGMARIVWAMRLRRLTPALLVAAVLAVGGCSTSVTSMMSDGGGDFVESAPSIAFDEGVSMDMATEQMAVDSGARDSGAVDRSQIITGDVYLTVDSPSDSANDVQALVVAAGGRVDSRSEYTNWDTELPSAYLWVRIPVDALDETLAAIEDLGTVESKSINNQDVTLQAIDLDARISVLKESISKLQELQAQAATTAELIEVEAALSERQAELDSLNSQQNYLSDQVQYASIGVDLRSPDVAPERDPGSFLDGIISGWNAMLAFFAGTIVFFGFIVPWTALLAGVGLVVWLVVWATKRTKK
jgi:hypothetical protein